MRSNFRNSASFFSKSSINSSLVTDFLPGSEQLPIRADFIRPQVRTLICIVIGFELAKVGGAAACLLVASHRPLRQRSTGRAGGIEHPRIAVTASDRLADASNFRF